MFKRTSRFMREKRTVFSAATLALGLAVSLPSSVSAECIENPATEVVAFYTTFLPTNPGGDAGACEPLCGKWVNACTQGAAAHNKCYTVQLKARVKFYAATCNSLSSIGEQSDCRAYANGIRSALLQYIREDTVDARAQCANMLGQCITYCQNL